jgi:hypothetical protein
MGFRELRGASKRLRLSHEQMDVIERSLFGDVNRVTNDPNLQ